MNIGKPLILTQENRAASVAGTKTQTRRVMNLPKYTDDDNDVEAVWFLGKKPASYDDNEFAFLDMAWPIETYPTYIKARYSVGEIVWMQEPYVIEDWCYKIEKGEKTEKVLVIGKYLDDDSSFRSFLTTRPSELFIGRKFPYRNTSARFMYKSLARHFFKITGIKCERLQDISEEDAEAEGINWMRSIPDADETLTAKQLFMCLWNSINEKRGYGWKTNPWVFAYTYEKVSVEI